MLPLYRSGAMQRDPEIDQLGAAIRQYPIMRLRTPTAALAYLYGFVT